MGVSPYDSLNQPKTPSGRYPCYPGYKESVCSWINRLPEGWELKRLKFIADINPPDSSFRVLSPDTEVSYLPMEAIGENGGLDLSRVCRPSDMTPGLTCFREGDVVLAKITPCYENGKGAIARGLVNGLAVGTTELHTIRPTNGIEVGFLFYLTMSHPFRRLGEAEMYGAGGQKRVPDSYVADFYSVIPPFTEQRNISVFLDRETAKIDALIAKKERLMGLLQENRTALIHRAVTQGLDQSIRKKNSGIELLGQIAESSQAIRLKHAASRIVDCPHETPSYSIDGEHSVIRTADVSPGMIHISQCKMIDDHNYRIRIRRLALIENDIVYTREGERFGYAALLPVAVSACLGQRMVQIRCGHGWSHSFLMWQLNCETTFAQVVRAIAGATSPHINVET